MPSRKPLREYIRDLLIQGGWNAVSVDDDTNDLVCPKGVILTQDDNNDFVLTFYYFSGNPRQYGEREKYKQITFPADFNIRNYLWFRNNGNYKLSNEVQFKKVINKLEKDVENIKITNSNSNVRRFYDKKLVISKSTFRKAMTEASIIAKTKQSYATSFENYLTNIAAQKFGNDFRKRTTFINKGEYNFLTDRLNLQTKRKKGDFLAYLNTDDINSIEALTDRLIRYEVLSPDFMHKLNDFFIREYLSEIIKKGRTILGLKSAKMNTQKAIEVKNRLGFNDTKQLETLWQKYFEKNLLYLIFSYKKIFSKVELEGTNVEKKYPDFIGINHYNGLDIIEIKTHLKNLLNWDESHKNFYFSSETSKALVQTNNYMDAVIQARFKDNRDKQKITNYTDEENLYHPRGIIIISSSENLTNHEGNQEELKRDFTKLRNSLQNIQILTFDEIIDTADEYLSNIVTDVAK